MWKNLSYWQVFLGTALDCPSVVVNALILVILRLIQFGLQIIFWHPTPRQMESNAESGTSSFCLAATKQSTRDHCDWSHQFVSKIKALLPDGSMEREVEWLSLDGSKLVNVHCRCMLLLTQKIHPCKVLYRPLDSSMSTVGWCDVIDTTNGAPRTGLLARSLKALIEARID